MPGGGDPCGCFEQVFGFGTAAGAGLVAGGQPTKRKPFRVQGTSRGTSPISSALSKMFPQNMPFKLPAPTTNKPFATTIKFGRFLGRWAPFIGWGLLASDLVGLENCMRECEENDQCTSN